MAEDCAVTGQTNMNPARVRSSWWMIVVSALCAASMWTYADRVLIPYQKVDAAAHRRPRGNLSDLYPRWLGARELLLHGRDPYSTEVTRDIQAGFYGRPLDSARPDDPADQQAFAYPVYVAFYLAPTLRLPFPVVQRAFVWILVIVTAATLLIWLRVLRWSLDFRARLCALLLMFGALPVLQGLKLQQISLLVSAMLALSVFLLINQRPLLAGFLLALATVKPQLVIGLLGWFAIWTLGDWRRRYRWMIGFAITLVMLVGGAELLLPHWIPRFLAAVHAYRIYTGATPILENLLPGISAVLIELAALVGAVVICWRNRHVQPDSSAFAITTSTTLAVTLLIIPSSALYNQVLLIPAMLLMVRERSAIWLHSPIHRVLLIMVATLLSWPWITSFVLSALSFILPAEVVQKGYTLPAWTALTFPAAVTALMLLLAYRAPIEVPANAIPA